MWYIFIEGFSKGTADVYSWRRSKNETFCKILGMDIKDGTVLYPTVRCTNKIQLTTYSYGDPITVSYVEPLASSATVDFIISNAVSVFHEPPQFPVQSNTTNVMFYWEGFHDNSGGLQYETKILTTSEGWTSIDSRNFRSYTLKNDKNHGISVAVRTRNVGGKLSDIINSTLEVNRMPPTLGGNIKLIYMM